MANESLPSRPNAFLCIGLTGRMASGKGEAVNILKERGYRYVSLSDMVREEAARLGRTVSRSEMQDIGNRLRQEGGNGILGKKISEKIRQEKNQFRWVIDGIRHPDEIHELRQLEKFFLLGIESAIPVILRRLQSRNRDTDRADDQELQTRLAREWGDGEPLAGQHVGACLAQADHIIENNQSLRELRNKLTNLIQSLEEAQFK